MSKESKHLETTLEPLEMRERLRNQWEALGAARHVLDGLDHSVRYALIIFSVVNTGAVILMVRPHLLASMGATTPWALKGLAVLYVGVALWILFSAISSLTPRLSRAELSTLSMGTGDHHARGSGHGLLVTLRPVAAERNTLAAFHEGWQTATGEELSRQLSESILVSKSMIDRKYAVLNRLYPGLAVMVLLAAILFAVLGTFQGGLG